MIDVPTDRRSAGRTELLRASVRERVAAVLIVGACAVGLVVSSTVPGHLDRHRLLSLVFVVVVSAAVLWRAWRPAAFVDDDRLVIQNLFSRHVLPREAVRRFQIARLGTRSVCVWVVTVRGAVAIDAAARPRWVPGVRDLDADVAVLNAWLTRSDNPPPSVSYLP